MSVLLETHWGDVVIDLDLHNSSVASRNFLKLVKARQYTQSLVHRIDKVTTTSDPRHQQEGKVVIACAGCPRGNGNGGASIDAYLLADAALRDTASSTNGGGGRDKKNDHRSAPLLELEASVEKSAVRFLKSSVAGRNIQPNQLVKGDVVALCINNIPDTIGSQFGIVVQSTNNAGADLDDHEASKSHESAAVAPYVLLGKVAEDDSDVLEKLANTYCDDDNSSSSLGRPLIDIRVTRALVVDDPFDDPPGLARLMRRRGVVVVMRDDDHIGAAGDADAPEGTSDVDEARIVSSPSPDRPSTEVVSERVPVQEVEDELDENKLREREELALRKEDKGRAIVLEMLGDLPDADIRAPENVLFICKLNPVTQDEDLELIFSRFDPTVKVDIIRDHETGASLQYAFAEFQTQQQAAEAYFKMNNALVDDRRIKVDFSQSVSTIWDKYRQRMRRGGGGGGVGPSGSSSYKDRGSRAMPRLGPSFETQRDRNERDQRRRGAPDGPRRGEHERGRGDDSRGRGGSPSKGHETYERRSSDRPAHRDHDHSDQRYDQSRKADSHRSSRDFTTESRHSTGQKDDRDEFGRVKGWDSRNRDDDRDRYERSGRDSSPRGRHERDDSSYRPRRHDEREHDHQRRYDEARREVHDRNRRGRDPDSRQESRTHRSRDYDDRNDRRRYDESSPRDRYDSPPSNGRRDDEEGHRRKGRSYEIEERTRRERRRRDSGASQSDTDSRGSRHDRKRKKEKRTKHHKKRKHRRRYSDDDDSGDDESAGDDRRREDNRSLKKKSKKRRDDSDRSGSDDDRSGQRRYAAQRDHDRKQSRKRSRSRS